MTSKDRKLILLRRDLLERALKITSAEGKTFFAFTNEVFEQALMAYDMQTTPGEVLEFFKMARLQNYGASMIMPVDLLNHMVEKLWNSNKEDLLTKWYELGLWNGEYLSIKCGSENWLPTFERLVRTGLYGIDDFSLKLDPVVSVKCVSHEFTSKTTECFAKFLEGAMHSAGLETAKRKCLKGILLLEFKENREKDKKALLPLPLS